MPKQPYRHSRFDYPLLRERALVMRWFQDLSIREIARRLDVAHGTVGRWVRGMGEGWTEGECRRCGAETRWLNTLGRYCRPCYVIRHNSKAARRG